MEYPDAIHENNMVTIPAEYLQYLEEISPLAGIGYDCEEVFGIAIYSLSDLLIRPSATLECREFDEIFYDDVYIDCAPEFLEIAKQQLIKWYLDGCDDLNIANYRADIYIGDHKLESATSRECYGYYCYGLHSDHYIKIDSSLYALYELYINLKQSNRLSDSDNMIHFIITDN